MAIKAPSYNQIQNDPAAKAQAIDFLKIYGYNDAQASRVVERSGQYTDTIADAERMLNRTITHGIGRKVGQIANYLNNPRLSESDRSRELSTRMGEFTTEGINGELSFYKALNDKGFLDEGSIDRVSGLVNQISGWYPTLNKKDLLFSGGSVNAATAQDFIDEVTGAKSILGSPKKPVESAEVSDAKTNNLTTGAGAKSNTGKLIDQVLATPKQSTKDLKQYDWWNSSDEASRKAAYEQITKITSSAGEMANYVLSKGLVNLQEYDWWRESPLKEQAWKMIQDQLAKNNAGQAPAGTQVNPIDQINQEANALQESELNAIKSETNKVDLSGSAALVEKLINSLNEQPDTSSLAGEFERQRAALGVGRLESELASIEADIKKLDADFTSTLPEEENRKVSVAQIRRRQSEIELQYNRQRRDLIAERDAIANELNSKYSVINTMVNLADKDMDNARQDYNDQFNRAIQMINLVKGVEKDQKDAEQNRIDNAQANITVMANLLKSGNINYEDLDPTTLLDIRRLEMDAGLPIGFTSFIQEAVEAPVVSFGTAFNDASGKRIQPVMTKNADGSFEITNIEIGTSASSGSKGSGSGVYNGDSDDSTAGSFENSVTTKGTVTAANGSSLWKAGLDVHATPNSAVRTPAGGTIVKIVADYKDPGSPGIRTDQNGGFGNQVAIQLDDGNVIFLSHLNGVNGNLIEGMRVEAGQEIGKLGRTGSTMGSTGYHVDITMAPSSSFADGDYRLNSNVKGLWTAQQVKSYISGGVDPNSLPEGVQAALELGSAGGAPNQAGADQENNATPDEGLSFLK